MWWNKEKRILAKLEDKLVGQLSRERLKAANFGFKNPQGEFHHGQAVMATKVLLMIDDLRGSDYFYKWLQEIGN